MAALRDILTPAWLYDTFFFGGDTTRVDGVPFPDSVAQVSIDSAIALAESTFGVPLANGLRTITAERYDYTDSDPSRWFLVSLMQRPVRRVTKFARQFGDFPEAELPLTSIHVSNDVAGQIQFIPGAVAVSSALVAPLIAYTGVDYIPRFFTIGYQAGFDGVAGMKYDATLGVTTDPPFAGRQRATPSTAPAGGESFTAEYIGTDKLGVAATETLTWTAGQASAKTTTTDFDTVTTVTLAATAGTPTFVLEPVPTYPIPNDIVKWIGMVGATLPADTAGDLLGGAGIASYSASIDGVSMNVNTTSSPENHGYSALLKSWAPQIKDITERSERKWRPIEAFCL